MLNLRNNTNKTNPSDSGFTLLEVMAALSIIAIVLVAVYRMQSQTIRMTVAEKFYVRAPFLAQSKTAQIMADSQAGSEGDSGDFGTDFPGYTWVFSIEDTESEELEAEAENLKKIDVTIFFNTDEFKYALRSYCYFKN
jgi:general secretion pathway protein I